MVRGDGRPPMMSITRLLCPIDFSDASRHALEHAVVLAQWPTQRLSACMSSTRHTRRSAPSTCPTMAERCSRTRRPSRLQVQMADALAPARTAGVPVETCIEEGSPAQQIPSGGTPSRGRDRDGHARVSGFERLCSARSRKRWRASVGCPVPTVPPCALDVAPAISPHPVPDRLLTFIDRGTPYSAVAGAGS